MPDGELFPTWETEWLIAEVHPSTDSVTALEELPADLDQDE